MQYLKTGIINDEELYALARWLNNNIILVVGFQSSLFELYYLYISIYMLR